MLIPPKLYCLVVQSDKYLIGYATYMKQYSTWEGCDYIYMDCLYLMEFARGLGIGKKLINRIQLEAEKLGCTAIQWQTPIFNTKAIKFYKSLGAISKPKRTLSFYAKYIKFTLSKFFKTTYSGEDVNFNPCFVLGGCWSQILTLF